LAKKTKTKKLKKEKASDEKETDVYQAGDFCYYLDRNNKIRFAEVRSSHVHEPTNSYYYQLIDQSEFRFVTIHHDYCGDDEKQLKSVKRK